MGKWTRRLVVVFVVWYILRQPGNAAANLRWAWDTALHWTEVGFVKAGQFLDGLVTR